MGKSYARANRVERAAVESEEPAENTSLLVAGIVAIVALVAGIQLDPGEVAAAVVGVGAVAKVATKVVKAIRSKFGL